MKKLLCALCVFLLLGCAVAEPGPVTGGCQQYSGFRDWKWPLHQETGEITSCFIDIWDMNAKGGTHDVFIRTEPHYGLDITGNEYIYAAYPGVIEDVYNKCYHKGPCECNARFGNTVVVRHEYLASSNVTGRDELITIYSQYSHFAAGGVMVEPGDRVTCKTILGVMGATGRTRGTHLDFRIVYTDGQPWCYMDDYSVDPFICEFFEEDIVPNIVLRCSDHSLACCNPYLEAVKKVYSGENGCFMYR